MSQRLNGELTLRVAATWLEHVSEYRHYTYDHTNCMLLIIARRHVGCVTLASRKLLTIYEIYFSHLLWNKQLTLLAFIRLLSGREWKAISIRAMRTPGDQERKQEMQRRKWETERGRVFPFIITISSSFCSVAVTGSIASITVSLSAMWRHDKLVTIHKSSELMQYCSQVSVPEERNTIDEISLIYWLVLIDWNVS